MSNVTLHVGDVHEVLATLPDNSVDLVVTSPPFLALRSYLPADHPDKAKEIGGEPNPGEFIDALLDVVEACDRVLTPHGSICIELGDTYSGSGVAGGDYNADGLRDGQEKFTGSASRAHGTDPMRQHSDDLFHAKSNGRWRSADGKGGRNGWPADKSLTLIPELFRLSLAYGRNPLTGRETPCWRVRNVVRWCRPNPPVGRLYDKVRPATSDMVIACHARDRYFDLDAVRHDHKSDPTKYSGNGYTKGNPSGKGEDNAMPGNPRGAPPLDHWWIDDDTFEQDAWLIPTARYKGSHYATFPPALVIKPILSMCPERVCRTCGEPSRRTYVDNPDYAGRGGKGIDTNNNDQQGASLKGFAHVAYPPPAQLADGWSDCGHDDWRSGVVLDPFAGTGTTLAVAAEHGRDAVGIDLDSRNVELVRKRVEGPVTVNEQSAMEEVAA